MGRMSTAGRAQAATRKSQRQQIRKEFDGQRAEARYNKARDQYLARYDKRIDRYLQSLQTNKSSLAAQRRAGGQLSRNQQRRLDKLTEQRRVAERTFRDASNYQRGAGKPLSTRSARREIARIKESGEKPFDGRRDIVTDKSLPRWRNIYSTNRNIRRTSPGRDMRSGRRNSRSRGRGPRRQSTRPVSRGSWLNRGRRQRGKG